MAAKWTSRKRFSFIGFFLKLCLFLIALPIFLIVRLYRSGIISKKTGWIAGAICSVLWLGIIVGANGLSEVSPEDPAPVKTTQVNASDFATDIVSEEIKNETQVHLVSTPQPNSTQSTTYTPPSIATPVPTLMPTPEPISLSTPNSAPEPTATPMPTIDPYALYSDLEEGSYGDNVQQLQLRLIQLGYLNDSADGSFGGNTRAAVEAFQNQNGFPADGIASAAFQMVLFSDSATPAQQDLTRYVSDYPPDAAQESILETTSASVPVIQQQSSVMVWIPTNGGHRYHSKSTCSGMIDPECVPLDQAEALGFTPCGRCY